MILIQANGHVESIPTTEWNAKAVEIMPGSQLFIPFKQSYFGEDVKRINQIITTLAVNRVTQ